MRTATADRFRHLPLWNALSAMLPTESQTWLLRTCLGEGEEVARSWEIWTQRVGSPLDGLRCPTRGSRWVLSELYSALRPLSASIDDRVMFLLRAARAVEEIRAAAHRRILKDVLRVLVASGALPLVMNGVALQEAVYPDERIRHGHDIDLLIRESRLETAMTALQKSGFVPTARLRMRGDSTVRLGHSSGACVSLWRSLFSIPSVSPPSTDIRGRSVVRVVAGYRIPTLSPADALLSVLGRAGDSGSRATLLWVCDAHHIIRKAPNFPWDVFGDAVVYCRKSLPILVFLTYLTDAFQLDVPDGLFDRLSRSAVHPSRLERDLALHGARQGRRPCNLVRTSRPSGEQLTVLRSLLCPSWSFARRMGGAASPVRIAIRYITGPLRAAMRSSVKGRVRNGSCYPDGKRGGGP